MSNRWCPENISIKNQSDRRHNHLFFDISHRSGQPLSASSGWTVCAYPYTQFTRDEVTRELKADGTVRDARQSEPDGFHAGFSVALASEESAAHRYPSRDLIQSRHVSRRLLLVQEVGRTPFILVKEEIRRKSGQVRPNRIRTAMRQATIRYSAMVRCSLSIVPSCRASIRQPFLRMWKKGAISRRAR